jgi:heme ABC exporter ATP-binding subunit CcmA
MIRARNLAKRFGDKRVFERVDVDVPEGGFLLVTGPNGSGKTTLLRILAGLAAPTAGEIELPERRAIGFIAHDPLVYRELSARENLTLFARLYDVPRPSERVAELLVAFGLDAVADARVSTFSRGMQQRLGLARVVLPSPELLVLDEPYNALDADGSAVLDGVLDEFRGRTFVVATHDPARVERRATESLAFP